MDLLEKVDDLISTDSEDELAIVHAIVGCLQTTMTVLLADGRRAKRARSDQVTFANETWKLLIRLMEMDGFVLIYE